MALIRYPGSKEKLVTPIRKRFPAAMLHELWSNSMRWEYREPFFGAGAVGFRVLEKIDPQCRVWLNDFDPGMVSLWRAVHESPDALIDLVDNFTPSAKHFYLFKAEDGVANLPTVEAGFRKLALHRMSFSGLGFKAGGPIGGKGQGNARYDVGCRWVPEAIKKEIADLHARMRKFDHLRISRGDFADLVLDAPRESFIYLDPPYYEKGPELYKFSMTHADHVRLAEILRECQASWVLSYDDHEEIRALYAWAAIEEITITYTTATSRNGMRPKNREILITPQPLVVPAPLVS